MRQHVNPLSRFFQAYIDIPSPDDLFVQSNLPIHLDIGCAKGKFLLDLASIESRWNFIGIDIRRPLVEAAERERKKLEIQNLSFLFCNANVSLESWFLKLKTNQLQRVSIQFPDPWFKKRHQKRRIMQPSLLIAITSILQPGAELFLQSDVYNLIKPMIDLIELTECFDSINYNKNFLVKDNPFDVPTEREIYALNKGLEVYRVVFKRNKKRISYSLADHLKA